MSTSRRRKRGLLTGSPTLLIATGAGGGILAANGDSASAALSNPDGALIPPQRTARRLKWCRSKKVCSTT
jgi:hypothetical protein